MSNPIIDLRSDTVTKPTPAMRRAMAEAEVGDDVYGEDPTVNTLQEMVAAMLGKEAALFVSSGTMGNLTSVLAHCGRGDEVILGDGCHIFIAEQGGSSALGGAVFHPVPTNADGTLNIADIEASIHHDDPHYTTTRLVALENTHNKSGGRVLPPEYVDAVGDFAHSKGLKLHIDGARLWNAAVALGLPPKRLVEKADSVSVCLSKGLAAPVGSVVAGSKEFIKRVYRARKVVGGAQRQAGIVAAAGIVAVTEMVDRLAEDHANAKLLANGLASMDGIAIDAKNVETNLVFFEVQKADLTPAQLSLELADQGIRINPTGGRRMRAVTNYHVTASDIERVLDSVEGVLKNGVKHRNGTAYVY
ncbi:MAG: low-specificity L-threonine aldolase [Caldilineaceae bacterium]